MLFALPLGRRRGLGGRRRTVDPHGLGIRMAWTGCGSARTVMDPAMASSPSMVAPSVIDYAGLLTLIMARLLSRYSGRLPIHGGPSEQGGGQVYHDVNPSTPIAHSDAPHVQGVRC